MIASRLAAAWPAARSQGPFISTALLPGALTVYLAFNAGGYFAGATAVGAIVLLLVLAARFMLAAKPAAGLGRGWLVAVAMLAAFALWTLISSRWSDAAGRALLEFDRALLYLTALVLFGLVGGGAARLRWMIRGLALAAVVICGVSLMTRVLPGVWPIAFESLTTRLSYPVTYWNALGLLAALGLILCFGMTSDERGSRVVRVLSCAAMPVFGSVLLLTLSRGGILVAVIGIVVFAVTAHPRALLTGLVASIPVTLIAVAFTYRADLLVSDDPLTPAARDQGATLALVIALCMISGALLRMRLLRIDATLSKVRLDKHARRRAWTAAAVALVVALAAIAVPVDLSRQYDLFVNTEGAAAAAPADPRERLGNLASEGRIDQWNVQLREFERTPLRGSGAGTYEVVWNEHRPDATLVRDGHSLYLEVLSELGLIGLVLLGTAILAILAGLARRIRGPDRAVYATLFAASLGWAIAAGIDWHWEMPVVTLWVFALGGAALAREPREGGAVRAPPFAVRSAIAGACCVLALLVPVRVAISQDRLTASLDAFLSGQCEAANSAARDSLRAVGSRPQPHEVLAYCALIAGDNARAVMEMNQAVRRDPDNWALHYGVARLRALAGRDPRGAAHRAVRLNPRHELAQDADERFDGLNHPSEWQRAAQGMEIILPDL